MDDFNFNYELKHPFQYAAGKEQATASFITLKSPTYSVLKYIVPIKQALSAAVLSIQEKTIIEESQASATGNDGDDDDAIDGVSVMQMLYMWDGDLSKVFVNSQELFRSPGIAMVDGETKLTMPLIEKIDPVDFEAMVGGYIANFLAQSLTGGG